ncbi:MAG: HD domain-containing protein [Lachnospiraceae bacterium]|nr:HD domain-containing protein [Lachnospiraceae bacterium]
MSFRYDKEQFFRRTNITALIMCAAGIALNILLSAISGWLRLPFYLDTAGTIAVAVMGGYLPGVIVGFTTNIIKSITVKASLYYGVLNILIAFTAAFLADRNWHKKISGIIGMTAVFCIIGGGLGACIPWAMEGVSYDNEPLSLMIHEAGVASLGLSRLLASLIIDLPDKAISVALSLLIIRIVPEGFYRNIRLSAWMQRRTGGDTVFVKKNKVRVISLQKKTLLVLTISLATVSTATAAASYVIYKDTLIRDHMRIARGTAEIAAGVLNPDHIDDYLETRGNSDEYRQIKERLGNILQSSTDISYLYGYRIEEDGCHVVFDIDTEEEEGAETGAVIPFDEGLSEHIPDLLAGREVEPVITDDEYGYLLSCYQPVYDSKGRCVCYVGADVDMMQMKSMQRSFIMKSVFISFGFFILLCTISFSLANYHLIYPINSIAWGLDELARTSGTQKSMDEEVKRFRNLDIRTGDEFENLFLSACSMTKNQAEQMRSIRRLSDSTAKMQDGLIVTMADLVESRDSDTGAHVQKTAAYVRIIVEGLKKKEYYSHKLTPKFMSDVVRSAPLHDIGKINIPDVVLNKPGKLTDEEYEIMKTHTIAGKRIMENAISTVEGDNYLKEARNMAAYHHERWDGKGYPEGIHGEVIPLSARIMAVADVFDALTSPRVYKPAFPLEKALAILEEGKGTQFDPKCVEVFMDALPEVKVVLRKYNKDA